MADKSPASMKLAAFLAEGTFDLPRAVNDGGLDFAGLMRKTPLAEAAVSMCEAGLYVFPLGKNKSPITANGFYDVSADPETTHERFTAWGAEGIGIATGRKNGIVIIDIDVKDPAKNGMAWFEANRDRLGKTWTHRTTSGGYHLIYAYPSGGVGEEDREDGAEGEGSGGLGNGVGPVDIRNSGGKLAPGVDVRANGGYAVLPSFQVTGDAMHGYSIVDETVGYIAPLPEWIIEATKRKPIKGERGLPNEVLLGEWAAVDEKARAEYAEGVFDRCVGILEDTGEGNRNNTLNEISYFFGRHAAAGLLEADTCLEKLYEFAEQWDDEYDKAVATIDRGFRDGLQNVAEVPIGLRAGGAAAEVVNAMRETGVAVELPRVAGKSSTDVGPMGSAGMGAGGVGGGASGADGVGFDDGDWRNLLRRGAPRKNGEPGPVKGHILNVNIALTNAPEWAGIFAYDSFTSRVVVKARPPFEVAGDGGDGDRGAQAAFEPRELKEIDLTGTVLWMQAQGIETNVAHVNYVINRVARENTYSGVVNYLDSLEWDGTPRLDTVLIDFLGAEDTPLNRVFGSKTLIAAVARAYHPGCQVKTVLTLEGPQNIGKSKFCATLVPVPEWFTDTCPDFGSKDAAIQLQGIWIQEHSEMATLNKTEANKAKAFISINSDRYRVPHGIVAETFPRQCIFVATINPGGGGYLKDETGASRFWPVECGIDWEEGDQLDTDLLIATRDQIWAEAVARFHCGESWWLDDAETRRAQSETAEKRYAADSWEPLILEYVAKNEPPITTAKILQQAIGKPAGMWSVADNMRVGAILKRHGWERRRIREGNARTYQYVPIGWSGTVLKLVSDANYQGDSEVGFASPKG